MSVYEKQLNHGGGESCPLSLRESGKIVRALGPESQLRSCVICIGQGSCTHETLIVWLPKQGLNSVNTS